MLNAQQSYTYITKRPSINIWHMCILKLNRVHVFGQQKSKKYQLSRPITCRKKPFIGLVTIVRLEMAEKCQILIAQQSCKQRIQPDINILAYVHT